MRNATNLRSELKQCLRQCNRIEENAMNELINKFDTYEKCLAFKVKLEENEWEIYWKDAGGHIIRESEFDDNIGDKNNFATIQFVDMAGSDGYAADKHIFKFVVFLYSHGSEDGFTMHDTIREAIEDYKETLKLVGVEEK